MKLSNFFIILISAFFLFSCDDSGNDEEEKTAKKIIIPNLVNVTYDENIYLACKINDSIEANLMFDTGAYGLILDSFFCSKNYAEYNTVPFVGTGSGSLKEREFSPKLSFEKVNYFPNRFHRADLKCIFGKKIDGIVGIDFLNKYVVRISYTSPFIQIISPDDFRPDSSWKRTKLKWNKQTNKLMLYAQVNASDNLKIKGNFLLDLGCTGNIVFTTATTKKFRLDTIGGEKTTYKVDHSNLAGRSSGYTFWAKSVTIKGFDMLDVNIGCNTDTSGILVSREFLGLLGNRILERFDLIIDFPKEELYLKSNRNIKKEFVTNPAGFGLTDRTDICEGWVVNGMIVNSEAEKIGIKQGDIVTHINNKPVQEFSRLQLRKIFKKPGDEVLLTIKRKEKILKFNLKLKEYL